MGCGLGRGPGVRAQTWALAQSTLEVECGG